MEDRPKPPWATAPNDDVRACLESLTGPSRGQVIWFSHDQSKLSVGPDRMLKKTRDTETRPTAQLTWSGSTYEIEAMGDIDLWVNGRKAGTAHLLHGDMIEFGEHGPMSRYRLCQDAFPTHWPVEEILSDAMAYAWTSRRPFGARLSGAFLESLRRIILETSVLFRLAVIGMLIALTTFGVIQYRSDQDLRAQMEQEVQRLEAITVALAEVDQQALSAEDFATLRQQLDLKLSTSADRLAALEHRMGASARVIRASTSSVVFLQGAYGLRQIESGKMLRHVLGANGTPLISPFGKPFADVDGTGAPIEFQFTGTGFLLEESGVLVTNRHVALPWTSSNNETAFTESGFRPEMLRLLAFLPGQSAPVEVTFLKASEDADLALLSVDPIATVGEGLRLADTEPNIGDEVILLSFSTGLRALVAQAGRDFLMELEETGETDFWTIAQRLSEADRIAPLASRGIVAQITPIAVVYDAETAVGGSGGPALNSDGNVIAVNAAILPEFGGANIGVPVGELRRLLAAVQKE